MKLGHEAREKLAASIAARVAERSESFAEIGSLAGVHPSQASRICRGKFRTASHNVVQICKVLGIPLEGVRPERGASREQRKLEAAIIAVWDRSPEDADRIVRVLKELKAFRTR
jgi:hypothetical protein